MAKSRDKELKRREKMNVVINTALDFLDSKNGLHNAKQI